MHSGIKTDSFNFQLENFSNQEISLSSDFDNQSFKLNNLKNKTSLNSSCQFFSEIKSDEFIQNYILYNFSSKEHINIIFGGCSEARELYSYAIMLDNLKDKTNFIGFDINVNLLNIARNGIFKIKNTVREINNLVKSNNSEAFLISDNNNLSGYQTICKRKFLKYFKPITQKEIQQIDSKKLHAINYSKQFLESMGIGEVKIQEPIIETQTFKLNPRDFRNCKFIQENVLNINNSIDNKSIDAFFFRNTLYQLVCDGNSLMKYMKFNSKELIENIISKIKKTLSPDGILIFGENESYIQGIDKKIIYDVMISQGFLPIVKCDDLERAKEDLRKCNKDENDAIAIIANIWRINRID